MVWQYEALSDYDLETVARDLLTLSWGVRVDSFPRGKDGGVDLIVRGPVAGGGLALSATQDLVVLVKHYPGATAARVERAFRRDLAAPAVQRAARIALVTSAPLTDRAKASLVQLDPSRIALADVYGRDGLDALLAAHPEVAQRNTKLWLSNGDVIDQVLHSAAWQRLSSFMKGLERSRGLLVETPAYRKALASLEQHGSVILTGAPGVGKTSTARLLALHMVAHDPTLQVSVAVSAIDEAFDMVDRNGRRLIVYDDFLGATLDDASLRKNEAREIRDLLARAAEDINLLLVMTSRGHVMRQAERKFEHLNDLSIANSIVPVELARFDRESRLHMLRNQLWFSPLQPFLDTPGNRPWSAVIDHPNYNPRHCESAIGAIARDNGLILRRAAMNIEEEALTEGAVTEICRDDIVARLCSALDDTEALWRHIVDEQLTDAERDVLLTKATLPRCRSEDLLQASLARARTADRDPGRRSDHAAALSALLAGMLQTTDEPPVADSPIDFDNPGIREIAERRVAQPDELHLMTTAAARFEQVDKIARLRKTYLQADAGEDLLDAAIRTLRRPNATMRDDLFSITPYGRERDPIPLAARLRRVLTLVNNPYHLPQEALRAAVDDIADGLRRRRLSMRATDRSDPRGAPLSHARSIDEMHLPASDVAALVADLSPVELGGDSRLPARMHYELFELVAAHGTLADITAMTRALPIKRGSPGITDHYHQRLYERLVKLGEGVIEQSETITDQLDSLMDQWRALQPPDPYRVRDEYDEAEGEATDLVDQMEDFAHIAQSLGFDNPFDGNLLKDTLDATKRAAINLGPSVPATPVRHPVIAPPDLL